jgi:DivIVA domain-containing protein
MEISPQTFREVEFREKRHGYHPEDVDRFLEQMEGAVEVLQNRLQAALERAQLAESNSAQVEDGEGMIRRTLVLAQRTADLAIREARAEGASIVASAHKEAEAVLRAARQRDRQQREESLAGIRAELAQMEAARVQGQEEVYALNRWAEAHRTHFANMLQEAATVLERAVVLAPAPTSTPIDLRDRPGPEALSESHRAVPDDDDHILASVPRSDETQAMTELADGNGGGRGSSDRNLLTDPDEGKLDTFFDDDQTEDRRMGGRRHR